MTERTGRELQTAAEDLMGRDLADLIATGDDADVQLPARDGAVMVSRSLRLPLDVDERVKTAAEKRGVSASALIREWIDVGLAAVEADQPISRAEALRVLAGLPPAHPNNPAA